MCLGIWVLKSSTESSLQDFLAINYQGSEHVILTTCSVALFNWNISELPINFFHIGKQSCYLILWFMDKVDKVTPEVQLLLVKNNYC